MTWKTIKIANPYGVRDVPRFTRAARTPRKRRQWLHVYESARKRGYSEGRAMAQASGAVARSNQTLKIPRQVRGILEAVGPTKRKAVRHRYKCVGGERVRIKYTRKPKMPAYSSVLYRNRIRNQNILTDAFAGQIASQVADRVSGYLKRSPRKKRKVMASPKKRRSRRNPHLAIIGANPRRKTRMAARKRNRKGQFTKTIRKRKYNPNSRKRRNRATPIRRRKRNRTRTITKIKYRTRYVKMANPKRRRRKRSSTRRRRRTYNRATPRRSYKRSRKRARRTVRRRRNVSLKSLTGRVNFMQVAEVSIGFLAGDKITTYLGNTVSGWLGITDPTTSGLVKTALGIVTAGVVWGFRPALGLGLAVGAVNGLVNQYIFTPLWGYASPYLPAGMAGLRDYVDRPWKVDNWVASGGVPAMAGMGNNSLNRSSL